MRTLSLGTPGELRSQLNALVISGTKTATAGLLSEYAEEGEEMERVGERLVLLDSVDVPIGAVDIIEVRVLPFGAVSWEFAQAEGEGDRSLDEWRDGHRRYWSDLGLSVEESTPVVCLRFRLVDRYPQ